MANKPILSPADLGQLLSCRPEEGRLFWKPRPPSMFAAGKRSTEWSCAIWNTRFAGQEAFTADHDQGYKVSNIGGRIYRAHRVIWALVHGEWPSDTIDHVNGNRADNRIENLRDVPHLDNQRNQKRRSTNESGVNGVSWFKPSKKWRSHITVGGRFCHLGYFETFEEAVAARLAADLGHGFHSNHGRPSDPSQA